MTLSQSTLDELVAAGVSVRTDPDVIETYSHDRSPAAYGLALAVVSPADTAQVSETMKWATRHRVPVVVRGAGSGIAGAATASDGCIILSTAHLNRILDIDAPNMLATTQPAVITAELDRTVAQRGLMYAPDPGSVEICSIGGNVATNAGGLRCVKYGVTRDSIAGLEVVLADGRVIRTGRRTVKNVSGYDLTGLFVGSEGTLGVVTEIDVRLRPRPVGLSPVIVGSFTDTAAAGAAVAQVMSANLEPELMELLDRRTLTLIDDFKHTGLEPDAGALLVAQATGTSAIERAAVIAELFTTAGGFDVIVSDDAAEAEQLIEIRRLAYPAYEHAGAALVEDVAVPRSRLADMLAAVDEISARHGVTVASVAHAGDGNVHPTFIYERGLPEVPDEVMAAAEEVFRTAISFGGTLTGEHGVGVLKKRWLGEDLGADTLAVCHDIKGALDPLGILNPGKAI